MNLIAIFVLLISIGAIAQDSCSPAPAPLESDVDFFEETQVCDQEILFQNDISLSKEEKNRKLCECLRRGYPWKMMTYQFDDFETPSVEELASIEIAKGLRQSLRNLLSISENFTEYTKTKTHVGNLLPTLPNGTPDTNRSCDIVKYHDEIVKNYKEMAGTENCPIDKETIEERFKNIFQTQPSKNSKLLSYYSDFKEENSTDKRQCLDRRDFIALKGIGQSARDASSLLLEAGTFENLRDRLASTSSKDDKSVYEKNVLEGFDSNPLLNLAATDPDFFKAYQEKLKKLDKNDQGVVIRDEDLYKLAFQKINENCHKLSAGINQYLCSPWIEPKISTVDYQRLMQKRFLADFRKKDPLAIKNFADNETYKATCMNEDFSSSTTEISEVSDTTTTEVSPVSDSDNLMSVVKQLRKDYRGKLGITSTPDDISASLETILSDSLTFKSINKKSVSEEKEAIQNLQNTLCLPDIESPLKEKDFDKMIGKFLSDRPKLQSYFSAPNVVKIGEALISFDPKKGELLLEGSNPDKLPFITLEDWKKIEADLLSKGVIKDARDSEILFTALDMRMNRNIEDAEDLKYKVQQNNPSLAKNLTTTDIKKTIDGNPPLDVFKRWGIPEDFSKTIQAENQIFLENKNQNFSTGQVTDLMYGAKTYAQVKEEAENFNKRKAIYTPSKNTSTPDSPKVTETPREKPTKENGNYSGNKIITPSPASGGSFYGTSNNYHGAQAKTSSRLPNMLPGSTKGKETRTWSEKEKKQHYENEKIERKNRPSDGVATEAERSRKQNISGLSTASPQGGTNYNSYNNRTSQGESTTNQKVANLTPEQNGVVPEKQTSDELSSGGQVVGGNVSRAPASEDAVGIPFVDPSKVKGLKKKLVGSSGEEAQPETEDERQKRLKIKRFEYSYIIPHGLLKVLGGLDHVIFFMELEGMRFKTLERVEDIDLKSGEESLKYFLRIYDFVPNDQFKSFIQLFENDEIREESFSQLFIYNRGPQTLKQTQTYALGTKEIQKVEVSPTFVNMAKNDIIDDKQIKKKIIETQSKYLQKEKN